MRHSRCHIDRARSTVTVAVATGAVADASAIAAAGARTVAAQAAAFIVAGSGARGIWHERVDVPTGCRHSSSSGDARNS